MDPTRRSPGTRLLLCAAHAAGQAAGAVLGAVGILRRGKPLHPRGSVHRATLTVHGGVSGWRVPLLEDAGQLRCLVRVSRAAGLPGPLPDVHGVAVRVAEPGGPADLLFATTGTGALSRHVLVPRRTGHAEMTTLLPVGTAGGLLLLRLSPTPGGAGRAAWRLSAARPGRSWVPVGELVTEPAGRGTDEPVRFDPVRHLPAGTWQLRWVRVLRDPAYVLARRWVPQSRWSPRPRASRADGVDSRR